MLLLFSPHFFVRKILAHYRIRKTKYLLWWSIGVLTFGLGTLAESINSMFGWNEINLKYWYIVGALLGGFLLAQGTVYLLMKKKFTDITTYLIVSVIVLASIFVIMTPLNIRAGFTYKLTGTFLAWKWVRLFSPLINLYSLYLSCGRSRFFCHKILSSDK